MVLGTRDVKYWVLGPSGTSSFEIAVILKQASELLLSLWSLTLGCGASWRYCIGTDCSEVRGPELELDSSCPGVTVRQDR